MTTIHKIPARGTSVLLMVLFIGILSGGCVKVMCPNCAPPCDGDKLPCLKADVAPGNPTCPNGGKKCAAPGNQCTDMYNRPGTCKDVVAGGTCFCQCQLN